MAAASTASRTNSDWLGISDVHNGVIIRRDGTLVRVIEVEPTNLALVAEEEKRAVLNRWGALVKEHRFPVLLRFSTRPHRAAGYVEGARKRLAELHATARTPQQRVFAALAREHLAWLAGSVLPASRQRFLYWWVAARAPGAPGLNLKALAGLGTGAPQAEAALDEYLAGVERLDEHVAAVRTLLRALGLQHRVLDQAETLAYLHQEFHPGLLGTPGMDGPISAADDDGPLS